MRGAQLRERRGITPDGRPRKTALIRDSPSWSPVAAVCRSSEQCFVPFLEATCRAACLSASASGCGVHSDRRWRGLGAAGGRGRLPSSATRCRGRPWQRRVARRSSVSCRSSKQRSCRTSAGVDQWMRGLQRSGVRGVGGATAAAEDCPHPRLAVVVARGGGVSLVGAVFRAAEVADSAARGRRRSAAVTAR
jgi:hypothetical protein